MKRRDRSIQERRFQCHRCRKKRTVRFHFNPHPEGRHFYECDACNERWNEGDGYPYHWVEELESAK